MDPHSPETFLYLRAIQGHSEGAHINPTLQDNVLLPDDVAEHIYHVGSSRYALDHSIGIDSGWQRRQERVTCVVLYVREPDVRRSAQRSRVRPDESQNWNKNTGKHTKTQYIGVSGRLLRRRNCSSIKHDPTQSSCTTLYLKFASRTWFAGSQEKHCTTKCFSLQDYRKKPYSSPICIMDIRILVILKREHPSTIKAKTAKGAGKPVAIAIAAEELKSSGEKRSGNIVFRIQCLPHSTVKKTR